MLPSSTTILLLMLTWSYAVGSAYPFTPRLKRNIYPSTSTKRCAEYDFFCKAFGTLDARNRQIGEKTSYEAEFQDAVKKEQKRLGNNYRGTIDFTQFSVLDAMRPARNRPPTSKPGAYREAVNTLTNEMIRTSNGHNYGDVVRNQASSALNQIQDVLQARVNARQAGSGLDSNHRHTYNVWKGAYQRAFATPQRSTSQLPVKATPANRGGGGKGRRG